MSYKYYRVTKTMKKFGDVIDLGIETEQPNAFSICYYDYKNLSISDRKQVMYYSIDRYCDEVEYLLNDIGIINLTTELIWRLIEDGAEIEAEEGKYNDYEKAYNRMLESNEYDWGMNINPYDLDVNDYNL